jgi:late competence protein required for DNA uptake (superfamily II DNA/RNA helicase)
MNPINLRDYQDASITGLRDNIKSGVMNQILLAPTGAGKTVLGAYLLQEAHGKGRRAVFVCDRISLVNQTSATLDHYGIPHGIMQAQHWRYKPWERIQVASAATLTRRGWPEADLIIVDECHAQVKDTIERISKRDTVVIGLTATPFSKGLGKHYDAMVGVTTTNKLIKDKFLVPFRVFAASEPDMTGAKVVAGEWTESEAADRAMPIIGDCVAEYLRHGEGKKFIAFGCNVAHATEMKKQFADAGVICELYTYKEGDEFRTETVDEFRKPDSYIRGLISVSALSKGFDVSDVEVIIMARPLKSSLAEHIQILGRGLRIHDGKESCLILDHAGNCIAGGSLVLTQRGLIPIELILLSDTLWDGHEFVSHKGVINRGKRPVIRYAGLTATADHKVKTNEGWRTFGYCAKEQAPIITTGIGGKAVRERENYFTSGDLAGIKRAPSHACSMRVHRLWLSLNNFLQQLNRRQNEGVPHLQSACSVSEMAVRASAGYGGSVRKSERERVSQLRRTWDRVSIRIANCMRSLDSIGIGHADKRTGFGVGQNREQRALRGRESSMGEQAIKRVESAHYSLVASDAQVQNGASRNTLCGRIAARILSVWNDVFGNRGAIPQAVQEAEREVWDILDCGPRNSFTCEGLLVHNCMRFWDAMSEFFETGEVDLDDGKKKEKPKKKPKEKKATKCPKCHHIHECAICPSCGHVIERKSGISHVAGTLKEMIHSGDKISLTQALWPQLCAYAIGVCGEDLAKAEKRALAMFKGMTGEWPVNKVFSRTEPATPTRETLNLIRRNQIAFSKRSHQ